MTPLSNAKHELFVQAIIKGQSSRDAYKAAGYDVSNAAAADASASRLLSSAKVQARIMDLQAKAAEKATLTKSWVLEKLVENVERAMTNIPVLDREGHPTGEYKYEGSVANRALELLGKEQGMFIDRKEVGKPGSFEHLDDAALSAEIKRMMSADPEMAAALTKRAPRGATKH